MVMVLESDLAERDAEITRLRMTAAAAEQCAAECDETRAALRKQTQTIDELRDELRLAGQGYADIGHSFDAAQAALSNKKELLAIAEADRDAARAQVVELQAAIQSTVSGLREHDTDYCAGPVGTLRRGACYRCRVARDLDAAIDAKATAPAGYVKAGDDTSAGVDPTVVGAEIRERVESYPTPPVRAQVVELRAIAEEAIKQLAFLELTTTAAQWGHDSGRQPDKRKAFIASLLQRLAAPAAPAVDAEEVALMRGVTVLADSWERVRNARTLVAPHLADLLTAIEQWRAYRERGR